MSESSRRTGRQEVILVVEDDPSLRLGLTKALRSAGYRVEVAKDGLEGIDKQRSEHPDLILCDVMLPEKNGFEVCEEIREVDDDVPIIFLTAKGEEEDKVRGLKLGADDYVVKPFGVAELLARVDAALRRGRKKERELTVLEIGDAQVDFNSHRLTKRGEPVEITALEMKLLRFLLRHDGQLVSRQRIIDGVWGADYFGTDRTVDNFITRLRAKLEEDPKSPKHIVTVRGAGYRFSRTGASSL